VQYPIISNIKDVNPKQKWGPKTYSATATYENGSTQVIYFDDTQKRKYELRDKLVALNVTQEVFKLIEEWGQVHYEEGRSDGYEDGYEEGTES